MNPAQSRSPAVPRRSLNRRHWAGLLFVLPSLVFVAIFFLVPLGMTVWMSLHNWPLLGKHSFTGLENYQNLLADDTFWSSLWFTTRYTLLITPVIFLVAYGLALLVSRAMRWVGVFRTIYFLPVVIGLGTSSLLWIWMFNDQVGILQFFLYRLGWVSEPVMGNTGTAFAAVLVSVVWKTVGFTMILLLVGMQSIPDELYEAAKIDGASPWQSQRHITLPLLRRTFALALILSVIGSYLAFDQFYIMTAGGPNNSTITVVYWIYRASFTYFKLGYGSALSLLLMLILAAISILQLLVLREERR